MADLTVSSAIDTFMSATTVQGAADALAARGADIASASTINLTTATGSYLDVTGTTTITAITLADGVTRATRFTGALTLTHGASLILPGAVNITTEAGDIAFWAGYAAGVVRCVGYMRAAKYELTSKLASDTATTTAVGTSATDTGLTADLDANSTYAINGWGRIGCSGTGGIQFGIVSPGSSTHTLTAFGRSTGSTAVIQAIGVADGLMGSVLNNANNAFGFVLFGGFVTTTTAGNYKITFGPVTGGQTATIYTGAWLNFKKM